jgi:hypothetical protein
MKSVFHDEYRRVYQAVEVNLALAAGVDPSAADLVVGKTGYTIRITGVWFSVDTDAAVTLTLRDNGAAPRTLCIFPASLGVGSFQRIWGTMGYPLQEGEGLDLAASAAGYAGTLHIEGYYEPTGVLTPATV